MDCLTSKSTEAHHILKFSVLPLSAPPPLTACSENPLHWALGFSSTSLCLSVLCSASPPLPFELWHSLSPLFSPGLHFYFFCVGHNMKIYEKHLLKCCGFLPLNKIREQNRLFTSFKRTKSNYFRFRRSLTFSSPSAPSRQASQEDRLTLAEKSSTLVHKQTLMISWLKLILRKKLWGKVWFGNLESAQKSIDHSKCEAPRSL